MKKKRFGIFIIALLLMTLPMSAYADDKARESEDPYLAMCGFEEPEEWATGESSAIYYYSNDDKAVVIPTAYDSRNYITFPAIRSQNPYGTCWAHAAVACMEINLIKKGLATSSINLSELQVAFFGHYSPEDRLGLTTGEEYAYENEYTDECFLCHGGNSQRVMKAVSSGLQPADENDTPSLAYSVANTLHDGVSTEQVGKHNISLLDRSKDGYLNPKARVVKYYELGKAGSTHSASEKENIKRAIMEFGAVQGSYFYSYSYESDSSNSTYTNVKNTTNHAITVIGWDDNYSKDNFTGSTCGIPESDGAWICRNSWGDWYGDDGYFYISYCDTSFGYVCAYDTELAIENENHYFYDNTGKHSCYDVSNNLVVGNVFEACSSGSNKEVIDAVEAWFYATKGDRVTCTVYAGLSSKSSLNSGTITETVEFVMPASGTIYLSKKLANPITVRHGELFSVVVNETEDTSVMLSYHAGSDQSFYRGLNSWVRSNSYNYLINVSTKDVEVPKYAINYFLYGGTNASSNPGEYEVGTGVASLANATRTGYIFGGWYSNAALTQKVTSISQTSTGIVNLYAKWTAETYTITYKLDGGINSSSNPDKYAYGVGVTSLAKPTRNGYKFEGWFSDSELKNSITSISETAMGSVTLYSKWSAMSYGIGYYTNGGTNSSSNPEEYTCGIGVASFEDPTRNGYDFKGWYSDENLTNKVTSISTEQYGYVPLYAKWENATYRVRYNLNGGSNSSQNPDSYTFGTGVEAFADPTRTGYKFKGWYSDANFTYTVTSIHAYKTGDVTLYAKWSPEEYTITYVLDGGRIIPPDNDPVIKYKVSYGEKLYLYPATKSGVYFDGWYLDEDLTQPAPAVYITVTGPITLYAAWTTEQKYVLFYNIRTADGGYTDLPSERIAKGYLSMPAERRGYRFDGWYSDQEYENKIENNYVELTEDTNVYGRFVPNEYNIAYVLNGGKNSASNLTKYTFGTGVASLANATRTGYIFGGWYSDAALTQKVTAISGTEAGDITLYAKWTAATYTITYYLNGGKNSSANPAKYTYGKGLASLADPSRSGYKFLGWYTDSAFKSKITSISKTSTSNLKIYAKWQKKVPYTKEYTVSKATYQVKYSAEDKITDVIFVKTKDTKSKSLSIGTVKINGKTLNVTEIAANALKGNKNFTSVTIGSSVKTIGKRAFYSCKNLKKITITTKKLTDKTVGAEAFKGLNAEAKIVVPASKLTAYTKLLKNRGLTGKKQKISK